MVILEDEQRVRNINKFDKGCCCLMLQNFPAPILNIFCIINGI